MKRQELTRTAQSGESRAISPELSNEDEDE